MTYNLLNVLQSPKCFEGSDLQNCKLTHNHKFIPSSFISTRFILLMVIGDTEPDNWKSQILPSEKSVQTIQIQIIEQFFSDTDYFLLNDSYKSIYIFATNWSGQKWKLEEKKKKWCIPLTNSLQSWMFTMFCELSQRLTTA